MISDVAAPSSKSVGVVASVPSVSPAPPSCCAAAYAIPSGLLAIAFSISAKGTPAASWSAQYCILAGSPLRPKYVLYSPFTWERSAALVTPAAPVSSAAAGWLVDGVVASAFTEASTAGSVTLVTVLRRSLAAVSEPVAAVSEVSTTCAFGSASAALSTVASTAAGVLVNDVTVLPRLLNNVDAVDGVDAATGSVSAKASYSTPSVSGTLDASNPPPERPATTVFKRLLAAVSELARLSASCTCSREGNPVGRTLAVSVGSTLPCIISMTSGLTVRFPSSIASVSAPGPPIAIAGGCTLGGKPPPRRRPSII